MKAYILINTRLGTESETIIELRKIPNSNVTQVFGPYDIVLTLFDTDPEHMKQVITNKVRKLQSVVSALTLTSLDHSVKVEAS